MWIEMQITIYPGAGPFDFFLQLTTTTKKLQLQLTTLE